MTELPLEFKRATEHAEETLTRHNPLPGWHIVTATSHPHLFKAFEIISDVGFGAGHDSYSIPPEYIKGQLLYFNTVLGLMTEEELQDFCIGGDDAPIQAMYPYTSRFLEHFFNDWEVEE